MHGGGVGRWLDGTGWRVGRRSGGDGRRRSNLTVALVLGPLHTVPPSLKRGILGIGKPSGGRERLTILRGVHGHPLWQPAPSWAMSTTWPNCPPGADALRLRFEVHRRANDSVLELDLHPLPRIIGDRVVVGLLSPT